VTYSTLYYTDHSNGGGYSNAAHRRVTYDGSTIHVPERVDQLRKSWVTGRSLADVDNYAQGFAQGFTDTVSRTAESHGKYTQALSYSGAYSAHLQRERLLNDVANSSRNFILNLNDHTENVRAIEIGARTVGGAGTAASVLAAAPIHAMLGPFAAISIPLHAGLALAGAGGVGEGGAMIARRARRNAVENWHERCNNLRHEYAQTADTAKQDRQSNAGLRTACGDETAHTHLKETMKDVDDRIADLLRVYQNVQPGWANEVFANADVPLRSDLAFYTRAEEHLFKQRNLSV
jgi:hypothetical protein